MKRKGLLAGILAICSALLYFASMAPYAFPGESAKLMALWKGLSVAGDVEYPLMAAFARLLGGGNIIAPICGVLAVLLIFRLVSFYISSIIQSETTRPYAERLGNIAGFASALVFMLTPAVREAASHLEPRLFDMVWVLLILYLIVPFVYIRGAARLLIPLVAGILTALGFCDSPIFIFSSVMFLAAIVAIDLDRDKKPYLALTLFAAAFLIAFFWALDSFGLQLGSFLKGTAKTFKSYYGTSGWILIAAFSAIPFATSVFSCRRAFNDKPGLVQWAFHGLMSLVAILAIATPLSPSSLMESSGVLPVVTSAFAAIVAGYLISFWWLYRARPVALATGIVFVFVIAFASLWNLFAFERDRGAFADEVAGKILDDLGTRTWLVTDGTLDNHLLLVAERKGRELNLIQLQRDLETEYLEELSKVVTAKKVGGAKNEALVLSLKLGVLPFVQDWFAADPTVAQELAIWGAPDLWYSANLKPVPEFLFFGADEKRTADWDAWPRFNKLLEAPKGWGSYKLDRDLSPVDRLRFSLRRHMGLVANNRGVWLQDAKDNDGAFKLYELVLNEIDTDNVCSLFNEIEMAGQKYEKAKAKKRELERRVKTIIDDKDRRYVIWRLGSFYGYIRNPDMFVRLGFAWARSGRPGDALAQIRRAIDFVPTDKQTTLLNMMAALYAQENDQAKSRKIYESILAKNENDHDALMGMMRLKLLDGDAKMALQYLERAVKTSPAEGKRAKLELSMVAMMKNDLAGAKDMLRKIVDAEPKDLQAWGLLAAVMMQQCDATKDKAAKDKILREIEDNILPQMARQTTNPYDYNVMTTKAFLLMRKGASRRREARDALAMAIRERPASSVTQDLVLGLDISLDDRASAERHARDVLRKNRNAPLANYVMGSLAIRRGQYREAESFLRKAADAAQPNVLALNDLAEVLRRTDRLPEAETYARRAIERAPEFYILHQTLADILMDQQKSLEEAEKCVRRSIELSTREKNGKEDVRIYVSLARVQVLRGDMKGARGSIRRVRARIDELNDFEKREFEEVASSVR